MRCGEWRRPSLTTYLEKIEALHYGNGGISTMVWYLPTSK